jgi:Uma2 family endonuclease
MASLATPEALLARWEEVLIDPALRDLPYKIELNSWGKVEMTPASNRHGRLQAVLALELGRQLQGMVLTECSILTRIGIRVPDVAWASPAFMESFGEITPFTRAPEICVEVLSPSNVEAEVIEKTAAYLAAGADEVWLVSEDGKVRFVGPGGDQPQSRFPVTLSLPAPLPRRR